MKHPTQLFPTITVKHDDLDEELIFRDVIYYPPYPATNLDPPEPSWIEWNSLSLLTSNTDLTNALRPSFLAACEALAIRQIEGD